MIFRKSLKKVFVRTTMIKFQGFVSVDSESIFRSITFTIVRYIGY